MAKSPFKSPYDIAPSASFADAAHASLRQQLDELLHNLPGTRAGDDVEALHDMRVASRRLRSALSVFAASYPARQFAPLEKQVAKITDALGAVRDADVLIEFMEQQRDAASPAAQVGLDAFLEHLHKGRDAERIHLVRALDALERSRFRKDFHALLSLPAPEPSHDY